MAGYTVVDVETTGLMPERTDRIVEIALTYVSHEGQIQDQWSTLINPERDLGPTSIHGVRASDVLSAPKFRDIAPYVLKALRGRIFVAHNASFDIRFVCSELHRAGIPLPHDTIPAVCTMRWSATFIYGAGRRLDDCCQAEGIPLRNAHSAAGDAMATASLLARFLEKSQYQPPWSESLAASRAYRWPGLPANVPEFRLHPRGANATLRPDGWLNRIVSRMPRHVLPQVDDYLAVLEMAMLDRFLAEHEKDALVDTATSAGLTRSQVLEIHKTYLTTMAVIALEDGIVTPTEHEDMVSAAKMLGLSAHDVDHALKAAQSDTHRHHQAGRLPTSGLTLVPGNRVVFTGELQRPRSEWEALAREAGLQLGGVTKTTAVVVAADPNSLSGKAGKARSYGVPIITESAFESLLNRLTSGT